MQFIEYSGSAGVIDIDSKYSWNKYDNYSKLCLPTAVLWCPEKKDLWETLSVARDTQTGMVWVLYAHFNQSFLSLTYWDSPLSVVWTKAF